MGRHVMLAFDLGAESGRSILGELQDRRLSIREVGRFANGTVSFLGNLHWNVVSLFEEMKKGLQACGAEVSGGPESMGVDTWGVDFGLLAPDGSLLSLPYGYRDARTDGAPEEFFRLVPRERVYQLTGIQVMQINSLFQLFAMARQRSPLLPVVSDMLFMPELFNYFLTGAKKNEFTISTTSQLYNPVSRDWEGDLFEALGITRDIMQEVVAPGTVVGRLRPEICREADVAEAPVIATASHDTAAAVAAAPAEGSGWAYISSGTWSLMGIESKTPIITDKSQALNFTNEGGVSDTFRVLKNIPGLWLLRRCREAWASDRLYEYAEMTQMALSSPAFKCLIEPDHADLLNPPDMPKAIAAVCRETGQPVPETPGEFVRCILESLALKCRLVLEQLRQIQSEPIAKIHMFGGGVRNELLCQFTANATGLDVTAGPVEATAIGNLLVQALALGHVSSVAEIREIVRNSFSVERYEPQDGPAWEAAYERFCALAT